MPLQGQLPATSALKLLKAQADTASQMQHVRAKQQSTLSLRADVYSSQRCVLVCAVCVVPGLLQRDPRAAALHARQVSAERWLSTHLAIEAHLLVGGAVLLDEAFAFALRLGLQT